MQIPSFTEVRLEIASPFIRHGYAGNVWATWLRDLAVDFTPVGCVIFMGIYGAFVATMLRHGKNGNIFAYCIAVLMSVVLVFSPFAGLLGSPFISYAIFFSLIMWLYVKIDFRKS